MAPTEHMVTTLLSISLLALLPTAAMAQDYESTRKTFNGTMIAIIVVVVVLVVFGVCSGIAFCCVVARNKERRSRQAREVKIANQKAAERRAREGGYEAAPQQEEGLRPYQYGSTAYNEPAEMDAYQPPMEVDSRAKVEMP